MTDVTFVMFSFSISRSSCSILSVNIDGIKRRLRQIRNLGGPSDSSIFPFTGKDWLAEAPMLAIVLV